MDQNDPNYHPDQMNQGYQQYYQDPNYGMPQRQAVNQYMNQVNYANAYNQNLMFQQQYQLEAMNQQMNQVAHEKEELQRQLVQQRQFAVQARQRQAPNSRQKEMDALSMLAGFQRSLGGGRSDPLSLFDDHDNANAEHRRQRTANRHSNDYYKPPSRDNYGQNMGYGGPEKGTYGYNQGVPYQSPFQNAANMMIGPMSPGYQNMYGAPMQAMDAYMSQQWGTPEPKKEPGSRTAEILMASLEKQNQILSDLTGSINKDRDTKVVQEAKEIENKIKQMEFESQAKQYQLFNHNILDALSKNYNRPIHEVNLQKHTDLQPGVAPNLMSPAQLLQLQAIMGNRFPLGSNPFSVMPSEMMKHQQKLEDKRQKERNKERKKKQKLKELLLLLGEDNGEEDEDEVVQGPGPMDTGKKRGSGAKRKDDPQLKALNDEKDRLEDEKKKKQEEEAKKKRIMKLRAKLWLRVFPMFYYLNFYEVKTKEREAAYSVLSERIGTNMENTKVWATKATAKGFEMITGNAKLNLVITSVGGKKVTPKDGEARLQDILKILKTLMDGFINNTKAEIVPAQLLSFLGDISQDYCYPPQNYLFAFELNRLNFTHNAALKDTAPPKVQMICCFFIMLRIFIAEMLLQPNKVNATVKVTDTMIRNVKTLASILMIIAVEYLRSRILVQNQNQKHLDPEIVMKPRSNPIAFTPPMDLKDDPSEEESAGKKKDDQEIIITGLYTKEQLALFFGKKPMVDEVKALVEGWCNSIEEIVTQHHKEEVKAKLANKKK